MRGGVRSWLFGAVVWSVLGGVDVGC